MLPTASEYDVAIAGAGPAGCAAAYDLARAGRRVLMLDKRAFPRPKACACGLTRKTLKALRYSVDPVVERICREMVLQQGRPGEACGARGEAGCQPGTTGEARVRTRQPICAMAVRERFDQYCLEQTLAVGGGSGGGVTLRKIESIASLRQHGKGVEIDLAVSRGMETVRAPVMIGADGANGQTRRLAEGLRDHNEVLSADLPQEPAWYTRGFALEATVPFAELPPILPAGAKPLDLVFDFTPLRGGYGWLFPKGKHVNIGVGAFAPEPGRPDGAVKTVTRALLTEYARHKLGLAGLTEPITGQYLGMGGHAYVPRGRVLLVGDAAGLVDPLTGEGIHSAIVSGQAAAAAVLACQGGLDGIAEAYARGLRPLQETLAFSVRAARAFYAEPERGFRAMRVPVLRSVILRTYADGVPHTKLISGLARLLSGRRGKDPQRA